MNKQIIAFSTILFFSTGCATLKNIFQGQPSDENKTYDLPASWMGEPLIDLEKHPSFGVPFKKTDLSDGSQAYMYVFSGPLVSSYHGNGYRGAVETDSVQCVFTFYAKDKVITGLTLKGNCRKDKSRLPIDIESP